MFSDMRKHAVMFTDNDPLQLDDEHPTLQSISKWIIYEGGMNQKTVDWKYSALGSNFKALKVSYSKANGSFWKMCLHFPYFSLLQHKLEKEANIFYNNPIEAVLYEAWNMTGVSNSY